MGASLFGKGLGADLAQKVTFWTILFDLISEVFPSSYVYFPNTALTFLFSCSYNSLSLLSVLITIDVASIGAVYFLVGMSFYLFKLCIYIVCVIFPMTILHFCYFTWRFSC